MSSNSPFGDGVLEEFEKNIETIKTGVYGEDVRGSIVDCFELLDSYWSENIIKLFMYSNTWPDGDDLNMNYDDGGIIWNQEEVHICRLSGNATYPHAPSDYVTGQTGFLISIHYGSQVKQIIMYFGAGSNVICKFHTRVRNNNTWSNWVTVDLLNINQSSPTSTVVLG